MPQVTVQNWNTHLSSAKPSRTQVRLPLASSLCTLIVFTMERIKAKFAGHWSLVSECDHYHALTLFLEPGVTKTTPRFSDCRRRLTAQPIVLIRPMIYYAKGYKAK